MTVNIKFAATGRQPSQQGFSLVQILIVVAIVGIVTAFGVIGISNARADMRLQNSARRFAVYVEKARLDSIRRHAATGGQAQVQTFAPGSTVDNSFAITMDFDGTGTVQARTFVLDEGVRFITNAQTISFDWRGRIPEQAVFQIYNGIRTIPVDVSGSGDITLGNQRFADELIPDVALAGPLPGVLPDPTPFPIIPAPGSDPLPANDPTPTPTPQGNGNGNGNGNGGNGNGNPDATPTPTPEPTPTPIPSPDVAPDLPPPTCTSSVSRSSITLSQNASGQRSDTILFNLANGSGSYIVTAAQAGAGNSLTISVSPSSLNGSGVATITISSNTGSGNRGSFTVNVSASPTCGPVHQITVNVGN